MSGFVGRTAQLAALRQRLNQRSSFCLVYGQRRVGKTFLLQHLLVEDTDTIFFLADETSSRSLLDRFMHQVRSSRPDLVPAGIENMTDWSTALAVLFQAAGAGDRRLVLVLDECQYLFDKEAALPSVLQRLWDEYHRRTSVHMILCGSALGTLARLGDSNQPLHGRFDLKLKLNPFTCLESQLFAPRWPANDRFRLYGVFGGMARHLAAIDDTRALGENVCARVLDPLSALHEAPYDMLRSERLSSYADSAAAMEAVAHGENRFNALAARTGLGAARLDYVLKELLALELLVKERRFGDRPGTRFARHRCSDPFPAFWFRYVAPNRMAVRSAGPAQVWLQRIEPVLDNHMGPVFESTVRQAIAGGCLVDEIGPVDEVGSYWSRDGKTEIDHVVRSGTSILFVESKWRASGKAGLSALQQLREHVARCPLAVSSPKTRLCIACNNGFTAALTRVAGDDGVVLLGPERLLSR